MNTEEIAIVIPTRLGSTRLPRKPLALIHGKTLIQRVWEHATSSNIKNIIVACDSEELKLHIESFGGTAIITDPNLSSGTDRIAETLKIIDPNQKFKKIINLQGDMSYFNKNIILSVLEPLEHYNIGTLVYNMKEEDFSNPNSVKAIISWEQNIGKAHWFTRANINYGYHHAGIYSYKRESLIKFVKLKPSRHEISEKLEQLRALDNNMSIGVKLVDPIYGEINTPEDLIKANQSVN